MGWREVMATPSVHFTLPSASLFKLPPASLPTTVPAPTADFTYAHKYEIPPKLYNSLLSVAYPVTIAAVYAAAVTYLNQLNRQRGNKPWPFSKTRAFYWAVVAHNVLLAAYSAWTFKGMLQALKHSWPGLFGEHGVVGAVDAMCKMQGPRGLGNGVFFNSTTNIWTVPSHLVNLTPKGTPDVTDLGRLWNEGLAYYGWLFYLSKFYEVLDTAIILAKGKTSSPLQTYHHTGAMLCMWAGIRYMSPPIWLFVFINSGIHTLMYTYYALRALAIPVPQSIKQLLTSMQITQIVVGGTYALAHLFLSYAVPVSVPRKVIPSVASAVSAASSVASSAATSVASAASSAGIGNIIRKVALRAAGEEGLAENVPLDSHPTIMKNPLKGKTLEQIEWHTENEVVPCVDTSGQAFAILLNLIYFLPLTYLFINFFIRSYTGRTSSKTKHPTHSSLLGKVSRDATKGVQRETQEEPLPLPEQTESVANAALEAAEKFVNELENEAVEDRERGAEKSQSAQNGGLGTIQG